MTSTLYSRDPHLGEVMELIDYTHETVMEGCHIVGDRWIEDCDGWESIKGVYQDA